MTENWQEYMRTAETVTDNSMVYGLCDKYQVTQLSYNIE
jgi:hypothetical protein